MQFANSSALRETLYRAYVTRASRPGRGRCRQVRQQRPDPRNPGAAPGRSPAAGLPPISARSRWCPRWPSRPQQVITFLRDLAQQGPALRREGRGRPARLRRRAAGPGRPAALGLALHQRKAQGSALRLQRAGGQAVLHRAQGAGRPVQDRRDPVRGVDPRATRRRSGTRRCEFYRIERARARCTSWSASSTWTRRRAPASAAAPGWTTCARAGCAPTPAACRRRWRTWSATSPTAWTASRRC